MTGLFEQCLAIVAGVCLNAPATIELGSDSIWTGARIKLDTALVISTIRSDNIAFPDRRRMKRYCTKTSCTSYYRYCNRSDDKYICTIYYNRGRDDYNKTVSIEAADAGAVNAALSRLALVENSSAALVPLAKLSSEGAGPVPPYCRPKRDPLCR